MSEAAFKWDDELPVGEEQQHFEPLPPGEYWAQVQRFKNKWSNGLDAPMAEVVIIAKDDDENASLVFENIILHKKTLWKIREFFISLGLGAHGEEIKQRWNEIAGKPCRVRLKSEEYNGRTSNKIDRWLDPDPQIQPPDWATAKVQEFKPKGDEDDSDDDDTKEEVPW